MSILDSAGHHRKQSREVGNQSSFSKREKILLILSKSPWKQGTEKGVAGRPPGARYTIQHHGPHLLCMDGQQMTEVHVTTVR